MAVGAPVLNIVDSTMLDAGLTKIADAIRTKGGTSAQLAFPDGMADAIAAIEAGGGDALEVITGTFTPAQSGATSISLLEYGVNINRIPKARYIFEDSGLADNDTSHTSKRVIAAFHVNLEATVKRNSRFYMLISYQSSGSNSFSKNGSSVAEFWERSAAYEGEYNFFTGHIGNNIANLNFYSIDPSQTYKLGCIVGRTYRWGVIL